MMSPSVQETRSRELAATIDKLMKAEDCRVRCGFEKAAAFVNDVFCNLASIDVRFEFDPVSLDDCRCEKIAMGEYNILCNLKHLPYGYLVLEGETSKGAVEVRLSENYRDSLDSVSWEDVCMKKENGDRFIKTKAMLENIYQAILTVLSDDGQTRIVCLQHPSHLQLIVNLRLDGRYKFNLYPSIKVTRNCKALSYFDERIKHVCECLGEADVTVDFIQIVAKPALLSDTLWGLTFNDLENRLVNTEKYECVQHCLFTLSLLQKLYLTTNGLPCLSHYNLQMIVLKELIKTPLAKEWQMAQFSKRFELILKSVKQVLERKINKNVFTDVNVLKSCDKNEIKRLAKAYSRVQKNYLDSLYNF